MAKFSGQMVNGTTKHMTAKKRKKHVKTSQIILLNNTKHLPVKLARLKINAQKIKAED